jgi:UDP-GlcNAc:undecaprenyl-phosphate/decaprenyl-phosphate GlcNAc-1-phosphate transferase
MVFILLFLTGIALVLSLFLTPLVRTMALKWNLVDVPDARKVHQKPIPRIGGIAVSSAYFGSCLIVAALVAHFRPDLPIGFSTIKAIGPATLFIFIVGLADDILNLRPWQKFAVQIAASLMVVSAGVHMGDNSLFAGHPVLARVASVVWLLACTNAVNLIDGLDGLAAGIALLATMTTLIASLMSGNIELTVATAPLAGALVGFLVFNSNPASIFLGDSGSLVLGFLLGCFSLLWSVKSATLLGMTAPLMALSVPLIDTSLAILRRFLRGQPIFLPDRSHVHHRLLALGLTHRRAVLFLYSAGLVAGVLALSLLWARSHGEAMVLLTFVCVVLFGIDKLRYPELNAARKILFRGGLRREISAQLEVQNLREVLTAASTAEDCWAAVQRNSSELGFEVVRMRIGSRTFGETALTESSSTIRIAITDHDWVDLAVDSNPGKHPNVLMPFVTTMQKALANKEIRVSEDVSSAPFASVFHEVATPTIQ